MKEKNKLLTKIKNYFRFDSFNAILRKELIGGLSTFLAMAYIIAVNPSIVGWSPINPGNDMDLANKYQGGLFLATIIAAAVATFIMGLYARIPVALAPGMGLNAFFAFTIAKQVGFDSAMTITILSGILYFIIVITPAREKISHFIPNNLKLAIGAGIGFFIAYVGLQNAKIITPSDPSSGLASTIGNFTDPLVILSICILILALILHYAKVPGAIIITMLVGAIILIPMILAKSFEGANPDTINPVKVGYGNLSTIKEVAQAGWKGFANPQMWKNPITYIGVLSFLYMDFFDTTGTLIIVDKELKLSEKDDKWMKKANLVDAISTIGGASIGATTVTSFVESTVGVSAGAKTGFSMMITSLCFGLTIALWPVLQIFMPVNGYQPITGPILFLVGTMMISQIKHFDWEIVIDIPVLFITMIMMMLTNSIAYGIAFGVFTFVVLNAAIGLVQKYLKNKKVNKNIVNSLEIPLADQLEQIENKDIDYLKRINIGLIIISVVSLAYIVLQSGITYNRWFM